MNTSHKKSVSSSTTALTRQQGKKNKTILGTGFAFLLLSMAAQNTYALKKICTLWIGATTSNSSQLGGGDPGSGYDPGYCASSMIIVEPGDFSGVANVGRGWRVRENNDAGPSKPTCSPLSISSNGKKQIVGMDCKSGGGGASSEKCLFPVPDEGASIAGFSASFFHRSSKGNKEILFKIDLGLPPLLATRLPDLPPQIMQKINENVSRISGLAAIAQQTFNRYMSPPGSGRPVLATPVVSSSSLSPPTSGITLGIAPYSGHCMGRDLDNFGAPEQVCTTFDGKDGVSRSELCLPLESAAACAPSWANGSHALNAVSIYLEPNYLADNMPLRDIYPDLLVTILHEIMHAFVGHPPDPAKMPPITTVDGAVVSASDFSRGWVGESGALSSSPTPCEQVVVGSLLAQQAKR